MLLKITNLPGHIGQQVPGTFFCIDFGHKSSGQISFTHIQL